MHSEDGRQLVASYLKWLNEHIHLSEGEGYVSIATPFLNLHYDEIEIFVETIGDNLKLTDDGSTLSDLKDCGLEINTPKCELSVKQLALGFGVKWEANGQLSVMATAKDFPQKKHHLIQAILAVHGLAVMAQKHVAQALEEDVGAFLNAMNMPYATDVTLPGMSGLDHV